MSANSGKTKFDGISGPYAETNHTLAKCGLVEALAESGIAENTTLVVLRRNLADQWRQLHPAGGYFRTSRLNGNGISAPNYRNVMVNPEPFLPLGPIGRRALVLFRNGTTRQAFYLRKYGKTLNFVEVKQEEIVKPEGAKKLLASLGYDGPVSLPGKANANVADAATKAALKEQVEQTILSVEFDADAIAASYIDKGRSLSLPIAC